jgi:hypothetical protein
MITIEHFMSFVEKTDSCWKWKGARNTGGYGQIDIGHRKLMQAHRFSFEHFKGRSRKDCTFFIVATILHV